MLYALSPLDGRYVEKIAPVRGYFSEAALMRYRCHIEIEYLIALVETGIIQNAALSEGEKLALRKIVTGFDDNDGFRIKAIESRINHDVKAIEYFIREKLEGLELYGLREWVHFGLTSQDINNSAFPLMIREAYREIIIPAFRDVRDDLDEFATLHADIPMLAYTHGQPASPTRLGKEFRVFVERMDVQLKQLEAVELKVKFGGATGNFNAHHAALPNTNWIEWADQFTHDYLQIGRYRHTTQIEHYDQLAALSHATMRVNTILLDLCKDIWTYISMNYLGQQVNAEEVGSSAMPHKVNPIDFENAEGNLGFANAIFGYLADKLPVSRLQRDLTDSTVIRNMGVPVGHTYLALASIKKGLKKIKPNEQRIAEDLNASWAVLAEPIQTILRREGVDNPYELLKQLTRGSMAVTKDSLAVFIDTLDISDAVKRELKALSPETYLGI